MKPFLLALFLCASVALPCADWAQERGQGTRPSNRPPHHPLVAGQYHALLIGVADYADPRVNDLDYPLRDAARVKQVLTSDYSFAAANVTTLTNPTREQILNEMQELNGRLKPEDHLLIFYAGHGVWNEVNQQGYWLPSDARRAVRSSWISNSDLRDTIVEIPARHTLLISDACFSGGLFVTREAFTREPALEEVDKLRSRTAMTSGALTTVPDRSVFVQYLLDRLERNAAPYLFAQELFAQLRQPVINNSKRQADGTIATPRYGVIQETRDEGGDFIFLRKVLPVAATPLPVPTPGLDPAAFEFALWQSADRSNEISEFEEYLRQYPNGRFAVSARNRIARLRAPAVTLPVTNPARPNVTSVPLRSFSFETAQVDAQGNVTRRFTREAEQLIVDLGNNVTLEMVSIPAGKFTMGSPANEKGSGDNEGPQHEVAVSEFLMGKYEITREQWRAVAQWPKVEIGLEPDPAYNKKDGKLPVERVSWLEADEFCKRLSKRFGAAYRLPREAEWEYAARAGTTTRYAFGDVFSPTLISNGSDTIPVGSLGAANDWGLFDMHGNVYEWCADWYGSYASGNQTNPTGPAKGDYRVLRGGSWIINLWSCRSAYRTWHDPGFRNGSFGFRVAAVSRTR